MLLSMFFLVDQGDIQVMFRVESATGSQQIALWNAGDGNHILFLPSYAELERVSLSSDLKNGIAIDGVAMTEGASCTGFALDEPYGLTINGRDAGTIRFCRSANVATMYIDTASGSMDRIHENKEYEESAFIAVYDIDGILSSVDGDCAIKGRGNSTWYQEKKPYTLKLSADQSLLGMQSASNWVLLSNAFDVTNLRNKLVYDFAHELGIEQVPECEYVDVFLNGAYNGLYLLAEKVEVEPERMNLNLSERDFLCKIEIENRWDLLDHPFKTQAGRTVEFVLPAVVSNDKYERTIELVNDMEELILSGRNLQLEPSFDLDSWVYRYLIDEVFSNRDADKASSYFYFSQGVFYSGPLWDYDLTFGLRASRMDPYDTADEFCCNTVNQNVRNNILYYNALYNNQSFYNHMVCVYREEFLPPLEQMLDHGIIDLAARIEQANTVNRIRWDSIYSTILESTASPDSLVAYLKKRIAFLNSAWLDGVEYCTVRLEHPEGAFYENISVKKGDVFESEHIDVRNTLWIIVETGEPFDFSQPVMEDVVLVEQSQNQSQKADEALVMRDYITIASIAALVFLLLTFGATDLIRRRKERRTTDARTKIPS